VNLNTGYNKCIHPKYLPLPLVKAINVEDQGQKPCSNSSMLLATPHQLTYDDGKEAFAS